MLLHTLFIFLFCVGLQAEKQTVEPKDDTITNEIRSFLACILPQLKEGIEDCDIPSLDPLQINELKLNNVGGGHIYLDDVTVKGITDLNVSNVDLSMSINGLSLTAVLLLPFLSLTTNYDADVTLFNTLHIYGNGNISLAIDEIVPSVSVALKLNPIEISVEDFNLELKEVQFQATGLLNDEYMSKLISNMIKSIIEEHLKEIIEKVIPLLSSGEGESTINLEKLIEILGCLMSKCPIKRALQIDALLQRR